MSEPEIYFNNQKLESVEELNKVMDEWQDSMIEYEEQVAKKFRVTRSTAAAIVYLRSRSRWTQEKENELIERDHAGKPIRLGMVLSGEF